MVYSLENPADDGDVRASTDADEWIGGWDYSQSGSIKFAVMENESEIERKAEITVTYTYASIKK